MTATTARSGSAKAEKLAQRLSQILALLHQGDHIDKHDLARRFQVDVRTIERDLGQRLYGIAERNDEGQWQLASQARGTVPASYLHRYASMAGTKRLYPEDSLPYLLSQLETPPSHRATHVQPVSHEDLDGKKDIFAELQAAVEHHYPCRFQYRGRLRHVHPYRLIHHLGVWYLAAVDDGRLKNFSVARIERLSVDDDKPFTVDPAHQEYINQKEDVWFTPDTTEVLLRVSAVVAHYFKRRDLLPRQQTRANPDGSLLVTTHISHPNQLLPVVRYWLPSVQILQPQALQQELLQSLRQALAKWED